MGHLARIQPIAAELLKRGHRIDIAACNLDTTRRLMGDGFRYWQAPLWSASQVGGKVARVTTLAHVLHNIGYRDPAQLASHLRAWRSLLLSVKPEILVCDSSPTALLAARGLDMGVVAIGTGFHLPPPVYPLPSYRYTEADDSASRGHEDRLTYIVNHALGVHGIPCVEYMGQAFDVDLTVLTALDELDHFDGRISPCYAGPFTQFSGDTPAWPSGAGPRVFGYLKPFPLLVPLLNELRRRAFPTVIYAPDVPRSITTPYTGDGMRFHERPVSMSYATGVCDLLISHAGYGLPLDGLLVGRPVLSFPIFLDQYITAKSIERLGAGLCLAPREPHSIASAFDEVLSSLCVRAAQRFADKYQHLHRQTEVAKWTDAISGLV